MSGASELPTLDGLPGSIQAMGTTLGGVAGAVEHTTVVAQGPGAVSVSNKWGPAIHAARSAEIATLAGRVKNAAIALRGIDKALSAFGDDLARVNKAIGVLQKDWDDADAFYARERQSINADPYAPRTKEAGDLQRAADLAKVDGFQQADHARLKAAWDKLCVQANTDASTTAKNIISALNGFVPASSRGSARAVAMNLTRGMPLAGDYENWKYAQADAGAAAALLSQFEKGDMQALKDFAAKYGNRLKDATFQLALSRALGAQGYTDFMNAMATYRAFGSDPHGGYGGGVNQATQEAFALVSASFATSVGGWPKGVQPDPVTKAAYDAGKDQWMRDLQAQGPQRTMLPTSLGGSEASGYQTTGYWAQGQMLLFARDGLDQTPSGDYFSTVGQSLLQFDGQYNRAGVPGNPYFTGLRGSALPFWNTDIYKNVHFTTLNEMQHLNDPVLNLLAASGGSEDAATSFLNSHIREGNSDVSGVTYLVNQRGATSLGTDQGLLSNVVSTWGHDRRVYKDGNSPSVLMARDYLSAYAQTVADNHYTSTDGYHVNISDDTFAAARVPTADLLTHYIDCLDNAGTDSDPRYPTMSDQDMNGKAITDMNIDAKMAADLRHLYQDLGRDRPDQIAWYSNSSLQDKTNPPAFQRVIAAQMAYNQQYYSKLRNDPHMPANAVQNAALDTSNFLKTFGDSVRQSWKDSAEKEKHFNDMIVDLAKAAVEVVPVGAAAVGTDGLGAEAAKAGIDAVWSHASGKIIDLIANGNPGRYTQVDINADDMDNYMVQAANQQLVTSALHAHRIIAPLAQQFLQHHYANSPQSWFTTANGDIDWHKIDGNRHAYDAYHKFLKDPDGIKTVTNPEKQAVETAFH